MLMNNSKFCYNCLCYLDITVGLQGEGGWQGFRCRGSGFVYLLIIPSLLLFISCSGFAHYCQHNKSFGGGKTNKIIFFDQVLKYDYFVYFRKKYLFKIYYKISFLHKFRSWNILAFFCLETDG